MFVSKADKIDALLESAILSFAEEGYSRASLRKIAARADMSVGMIHIYYGSKVDLYKAAHRETWMQFARERQALLQTALARTDPGPPELADVIYALAEPIVRRMVSGCKREEAQLRVIQSLVAEQEHMKKDPVTGHALVRWVDAFARACPQLTRKELMWAYGYVRGVIWSWNNIDHRFDDLVCDDLQRHVGDVLDEIVCFCCAGIEAIIARSLQAREPRLTSRPAAKSATAAKAIAPMVGSKA